MDCQSFYETGTSVERADCALELQLWSCSVKVSVCLLDSSLQGGVSCCLQNDNQDIQQKQPEFCGLRTRLRTGTTS